MLSRWFTVTLSAISASFGEVYNPLNNFVRRVIEKMKEKEPLLLVALGIFLIFLTTGIPDLSNWVAIILPWIGLPTQFVYLVTMFVAVIIAFLFAWFVITLVSRKLRAVNEIEEAKKTTRLKEAFKEALKEYREEQHKEAIKKAGDW